jgi:hypothetical protein
MTNPMVPATTKPRGPASRVARLRRVLTRLAHRRLPITPAVRRVWREVAPGEWRWIHVDGQAATK